MSRWFRFYDDALNDPKAQALPDALFKAWINVLCIASKHDGALPALRDVAFLLRLSEAKAAEMLTKLSMAGMLDRVDGGFTPHNWDARQYKSDSPNERVKRHREGKRNAACNVTSSVTVTPPEAEQKQIQNQSRADACAGENLGGVEAEFRTKIVQTFESANSPSVPDTSRAALWLGQGYDPAICLGVIADIVRRKPDLATLNYFDKPIQDAHNRKNPKRIELDNGAAARLATKVHVKVDTPQWEAWAAHLGKRPAYDRNFGWYFDSEWPPGHQPRSLETSAMGTMQ